MIDDHPENRALRARIAAHSSWARTSDRSARAQAAASARKAYFTELARRSVQSRRAKAAQRPS